MSNAYIEKIVEKEIARRIAKGELFTPAMVNADLTANCDLLAKMMTIAVNRGAGIGKKKFKNDIQPVLDGLLVQMAQTACGGGAERWLKSYGTLAFL